jgi:hypothetical protein
MTCVTLNIDDLWRLKAKPCWPLLLKLSLLISDPVMSQRNTVLEIKKGLWFLRHSKQMSPASSKKTSCAFNTFIQSLPSVWPLPGTLERGKNYNSAKTWQRSKVSPKFMSFILAASWYLERRQKS